MRVRRQLLERWIPRRLSAAVLTAGALSGCGNVPSDAEAVGELHQALDVCNETVPADRFVDGLPAYAQCDSTTGSIWSNNGVDTSTSSQGEGWLRTQQGGGYQCTEWAWRYMHFKWGVDYRSGNAGSWCDGKLPATLTKTTVPVHGDLIVFAPGSCGADATTGHVAVVDVVNTASSSVAIVEQNRAGRRNSKIDCALCFLHAVANDGSPSAGSGGGAGNSGGHGGVAGSSAGQGGSAAAGGAAVGGSPPLAGSGGGATIGGAATGGTAAGGAAADNGGSSSSGGLPAASAGTGGALSTSGGPSPEPGPEADEAGCSVAPPTDRSRSLGLWGLLLVGLVARRRR